MFKRDAKRIMTLALQSPEGMFNALAFAVATANCPFGQSVNTMTLLRKWGADLPFIVAGELTVEQRSMGGCGLTASKLSAYQYLWANRFDIWQKYTACHATEGGYLVFWNYILDCLPGMGLVKASFAVQMLFNMLGCIDIHNARELGHEKCPTGRSKKQRPVYLNIQSVKTSEGWWDDWCNMLAAKYPGQFSSGDHVSKLHQIAVTGSFQ